MLHAQRTMPAQDTGRFPPEDLLPRLEGDDRESLAACIGRKALLVPDQAALDRDIGR